MSGRQVHRYKQVLLQVTGGCDCSSRLGDEPASHPDMAEQAMAAHAEYIHILNEEIRFTMCHAARRALERIEHGGFGRCVDCGEPINSKRLAAIPWTERCVPCQQRWEESEELERVA